LDSDCPTLAAAEIARCGFAAIFVKQSLTDPNRLR